MEDFNIKPTKRIFIPSFNTVFGPGKFKKLEGSSKCVLAAPVVNPPVQSNVRYQPSEIQSRPKFRTQRMKPQYLAEVNLNSKKTTSSKGPVKQTSTNRRKVFKSSNSSQQVEKPVSSFPPPVYYTKPVSSSQPDSFPTYKTGSSNLDVNKNQCNLSNDQSVNFIARPMPDFSNPFTVNYPGYKSTNPLPVALNTRTRAQNRELFEEQRRENTRRLETREQALKEDMVRREKEEVRAIRKQMEFKARPVAQGSQQLPCVPARGPTVPHGPQLVTQKRSQIREFLKVSSSYSSLSESSTTFSN